MELAAFALAHLLLLAALAAIVRAAGALAGRGLSPGVGELPAAFRLALGFALFCQLLLLLGFFGWLRPLPILVVVVLLLALSWRGIAVPRLPGSARMRLLAPILGLPVFLLALYPPLGFDQTLYHLPFARAFARTGGLPFLGELRFPVFPPLVEALQAAIWLLAGEIATQLAGLLAMFAALGLLWTYTGEKAGEEAGFFAAAMFFGSPCVVYLATCGYLEPILALLVLGALYAAEKGAASTAAGWPLAAGLLAGSAAASKYHGLFFAAATAALLLGPGGWRVNLRRLALFGAAALLAAGPSYARIWWHSGSPLFPFYPEIFGSGPWTEEILLPRGEERWPRVTTLIWDLIFRRDLVGRLPPYSPSFLLALPAAVWALWRPELRRLALVVLCFLVIAPTHGHYFTIVAPIWALLLAAGLARLVGEGPRRRWLAAAAIVVALGGPAYAIYRIGLLGPPPATAVGRDRLLAEQLPAYPAILFLNGEAGGQTVWAAGPVMARMTSYYGGILLGDVNGADSVGRIEKRAAELGSLGAAIEEVGAGWLLVESGEKGWQKLAEDDKRLERVFADPGAAVWRLRPR
jgi:hypothetical protein